MVAIVDMRELYANLLLREGLIKIRVEIDNAAEQDANLHI